MIADGNHDWPAGLADLGQEFTDPAVVGLQAVVPEAAAPGEGESDVDVANRKMKVTQATQGSPDRSMWAIRSVLIFVRAVQAAGARVTV